jgi:hypothetical protein
VVSPSSGNAIDNAGGQDRVPVAGGINGKRRPINNRNPCRSGWRRRQKYVDCPARLPIPSRSPHLQDPPAMSLIISILITFLVIILILYLVNLLPIDGRAKQIVRVIVIVIGIISMLKYLAVF